MAAGWTCSSRAHAQHTMQGRMLRQPGSSCSTKSTDDAWILPVVSVMKMVAQWRTASAKTYGIAFGIFVPVNAPARQPRGRQRGGVQEGFGTATDQVERR